MNAIEITLPDELRRFVETQSSARGFGTPSDYVQALVEADRLRAMRSQLENSLVEAARGPSTPLTEQDFEGIRRRGRALIAGRRGA